MRQGRRIGRHVEAVKKSNDDDLIERAATWSREDPDAETRAEIADLVSRNDTGALCERFAGAVDFGTAGLRGIVGAGPARMNRAVVRIAMAGLAHHLLERGSDAVRRGVVVGRDARRMSEVFADEIAGVLAGQGIPAHVSTEVVPTPLVAFATMRLGAIAGVMVTASHNPPEYNGIKIYDADGAQIAPPDETEVAEQIRRAGPPCSVRWLSPEEARNRGLRFDLDDGIGRTYLDAIGALARHPGCGRDLRIVYTPLHGVGGKWTEAALSEAGFTNVLVVHEQRTPDASFPTVQHPNPEEPGALDLAWNLAERNGADLVLANDPDADRLSAAARDDAGRLKPLSGNEVGVLLGHHALTHAPAGTRRPVVISSIVSSPALGRIAADLGAEHEETLTGFKWIARRARALEREGATFLFGYEEALGYSMGRIVRDKDGIGAAVALADLAGWCRSQSITLWRRLEKIQELHGLFLSAQRSVRWGDAESARQSARLLDEMRSRPPASFGSFRVARIRDYFRGVEVKDGKKRSLSLSGANVLVLHLDGGLRVILRPSGTEPKLKLYFDLEETAEAGEPMANARRRGEERLAQLVETFMRMVLSKLAG
ncbi:MAG: phospho-sugar mutase [Vicinamibacteria bacterium]|nr:phospho-sugar mutase [Vicinamibacteria bacterium]